MLKTFDMEITSCFALFFTLSILPYGFLFGRLFYSTIKEVHWGFEITKRVQARLSLATVMVVFLIGFLIIAVNIDLVPCNRDGQVLVHCSCNSPK